MAQVYTGNPLDHVDQLFNAVASFGTQVSETYRNEIEERAKIDTMHMQAQLEQDTNDFMLELQQDGNYEDWGKKADEFLQKRRAEMSNSDSPYYCRNNATARMFDSVLLNNRNSVQQKVGQMQLNYMQDQGRLTLDDTLNKYFQNKTSDQDYVDKCMNAINVASYGGVDENGNEIKGGLLNPDQKAQLMDTVVQKATYSSANDLWTKTIDEHPDWTQSERNKYVEENTPAFTVNGSTEYAEGLDRKTFIQKASADANTQWRQHQKENNEAVYSQNSQIRAGLREGKSSAYYQALAQQKKIRAMKHSEISPEDQRIRDEELDADIKMYLDGKTATSSHAKSGIEGEKTFAAIKADMHNGEKSSLETYMTSGDNMDGTIYSFRNSYVSAYADRINTVVSNLTKEGYKPEQISQMYSDSIGEELNHIIELGKGTGVLPIEAESELQAIIGSIKTTANNKKTPQETKEFCNTALEFMLDTVNGMSKKNMTKGAFTKAYEDFTKTQNAKNFDRLVYGNKYENEDWDEKDLVKALNQQKNDALIWTDAKGGVHAPEGVEKGIWLGKATEVQKQDLLTVLKKDNPDATLENVTQIWELNEEGTDKNARLNFITNGKKYRYITDEKGKNVILQSCGINDSWNNAETVEREKIKKPSIIDKAKQAVKEAFEETEEQKAAKAALKESNSKAYDAAQEFIQKMPEEFKQEESDIFNTGRQVENFPGTPDMWNNLSDDEKRGYIDQYLAGAYDEKKSYTGIDKHRNRYNDFMKENN